jgi:hypothetical protein
MRPRANASRVLASTVIANVFPVTPRSPSRSASYDGAAASPPSHATMAPGALAQKFSTQGVSAIKKTAGTS